MTYDYNENDFFTDEKGKYLKPDTLHAVLSKFSTGEDAERYLVEDNETGKVYLKASLNQNNPAVTHIVPADSFTALNPGVLDGKTNNNQA